MEINICPEWLMAKLRVSPGARRPLALFVSGIVALAIAPILIRLPHVCLMQKLLHIPCPGCGVLHGITGLLQLKIAGAMKCNPAAITLAGMFTFQIITGPVAIFSPRARPLISEISRLGSKVALGCLFTVWILRLILGGLKGGIFLLSQMQSVR
jgi:hypothetical protein